MQISGLKILRHRTISSQRWLILSRALSIGLLSLSVQGSQTVEAPCSDCSALHLRPTQSMSGLTGCYLTGMGQGKAQIRISRISEDTYELDLRKSLSRTPFLVLRTADGQDLKTVSAGFGMQLEDGISAPEAANFNTNPVGVYRGRDATGKRITLAYLLFYNGNLEPVACDTGL